MATQEKALAAHVLRAIQNPSSALQPAVGIPSRPVAAHLSQAIDARPTLGSRQPALPIGRLEARPPGHALQTKTATRLDPVPLPRPGASAVHSPPSPSRLPASVVQPSAMPIKKKKKKSTKSSKNVRGNRAGAIKVIYKRDSYYAGDQSKKSEHAEMMALEAVREAGDFNVRFSSNAWPCPSCHASLKQESKNPIGRSIKLVIDMTDQAYTAEYSEEHVAGVSGAKAQEILNVGGGWIQYANDTVTYHPNPRRAPAAARPVAAAPAGAKSKDGEKTAAAKSAAASTTVASAGSGAGPSATTAPATAPPGGTVKPVKKIVGFEVVFKGKLGSST